MDPRDEVDPEQLETLASVFREQLLACLEECAQGRKGLFSHFDGGEEESGWLEADRLAGAGTGVARGFYARRKNRMRCATSSSICARFTAKAIPENESWRGRFLSGSKKVRWA